MYQCINVVVVVVVVVVVANLCDLVVFVMNSNMTYYFVCFMLYSW